MSRPLIKSLASHRLLVLACAIQVGFVLLRTANLYVTGFMTSDEANYILRSIVGLPYGDRLFFDYVLIGLFRLLQINSVTGVFILFPFYIGFWSLSFLLLAYKTLGMVTTNATAKAFVIFTIPFIITYSLLSVGFLTETPALVMCTLGIYALLRYLKVRRDWYLPAVSTAAFVAASFTREPYLFFPIVGVLFWVTLAFSGRLRPFAFVLILVPLSLLFVQPFSPLTPFLQGAAPLVLPTGSGNSTVTTTLSTISTSNSTSPIIPPSTGGFWTVGSTLILFFAGVSLGWNPVLFVVGVAGFLVVLFQLRRDTQKASLFLLSLTALACFMIVALQYSGYYHFYTTQGISTLIRYSNPSILAYVLIAPTIYEKLSARRLKIIAVVLVGFTVVSVGAYSSLTQSNLGLTYSAYSFSHEYAPLEARQYFLLNASAQRPILTYIAWDWKAGQLYTHNIPGMQVYPTFADMNVNESDFLEHRPSSFYIVGAAPLTSGLNASYATLGLVDPPPFLIATFATFLNLTSPLPQTTYHVQSVHMIFEVPTGYLLKVYVSWQPTGA